MDEAVEDEQEEEQREDERRPRDGHAEAAASSEPSTPPRGGATHRLPRTYCRSRKRAPQDTAQPSGTRRSAATGRRLQSVGRLPAPCPRRQAVVRVIEGAVDGLTAASLRRSSRSAIVPRG